MDFGALGALFEGAASGIEAGTKLGLLAAQQKTANQLKDSEIKKNTAETAKAQQEVGLAKIGKLTDMYKEVGAESKPVVFKAWADQVNTLYGTQIDPNSEATNSKYMEDFGKLINARQKGTLAQDDFLHLAGELRTKMDKEGSTQAGGILSDLPETINAKAPKEKPVTPEDAAKRITEVTKLYADVGKRSDMEAMAIAQDPNNAKFFGSTTPQDKAAIKARLLSEIQLMNTHLPPALQVKPVTQAQYDVIKQQVEKKTGRPVGDAELMKKLVITDAEANANPQP